MRYSREVLVTVLTALAVGLSALPAAADINDIGTLTGVAEMGKTFWSGNDCDKTGNATVVGEGLYLAGSPKDLARERQGAWHLRAAAVGALVGPVELEACGWLGPLDGTVTNRADRNSGFGPACGASKGHHGMGEIRRLDSVPFLKLMELGWKDTVGNVFTIRGKYQQYDTQTGAKLTKFGTVLLIVTLQPTGPEDCLTFPGAQSFTLTGNYSVTNTGDTKPPKVEKEPLSRKECKETDPNQDKAKDQGDLSDPDWKRPCPSARK